MDDLSKVRNRYLNLLENALTGTIYCDPADDDWSGGLFNKTMRALGRDWPALAHTMIGTARMRNLRHLCEWALADGIAGDFIETGVWRGGSCIFMRGILEAYADATRRVFVADSFEGLPPPNTAEYPADAGYEFNKVKQLSVSLDDVKRNFQAYGLLDERVVFLKGWFKDTLHEAPIDSIAVLRLDGDLYESTIQSLDALYHKVSPGGFVIIDDYFLQPCANAVTDFRERHAITSPLLPVDDWAKWWRVEA